MLIQLRVDNHHVDSRHVVNHLSLSRHVVNHLSLSRHVVNPLSPNHPAADHHVVSPHSLNHRVTRCRVLNRRSRQIHGRTLDVLLMEITAVRIAGDRNVSTIRPTMDVDNPSQENVGTRTDPDRVATKSGR